MAAEPATAGGAARLAATRLAKTYGQRHALEALDLTVAAGTIVAVVGANGAGKSTLVGCLAGAIRCAGRVTLDELPIAPDGRGRVVYLPQRVRLPAAATVGEVLRLFAAVRPPSPDRAALPPDFVPPSGEPIGSLSGGQARRVALAATIAGSPDLMLLDEPFANLDDDARRVITEALAAHRAAGAVIIVASPTAVELLALADRVLVLEAGRVSFDMPAATYLARLEISIWVAVDGPGGPASLHGLPHVVRERREGRWMVLDCLEARSVELLRAIELRGVAPERVRLGGPVGSPVSATSPNGEAG